MIKRVNFILALMLLAVGCTNQKAHRIGTERGLATADVHLVKKDGLYYKPGDDDSYSGLIIYHLENGEKYSEEEVRDGLTISTTVFNRDGSVKERTEIEYEGTEPAVSTTFYNSGGKKRQYEMIPPEEDGIFHIREWYENGQIKSEVPMNAEGEYHGVIKIWDESGNVMKQEEYRNGQLIASGER